MFNRLTWSDVFILATFAVALVFVMPKNVWAGDNEEGHPVFNNYIELYGEVFVEALDSCTATITQEGTYTSMHCLSERSAKAITKDIIRYGIGNETSLPECTHIPAVGEVVRHLGYPGIWNLQRLANVWGIVYRVTDDHIYVSSQVYPGMSGGATTDEDMTCVYGINERLSVKDKTGAITSRSVRLPL